MIAAQADGARGWLLELVQVALAAAGVWVVLSAVDIAMYERVTNGHDAASAAPLACVMPAPLTERVKAGRIDEPSVAPVASAVPERSGELAAALARVSGDLSGITGGVRQDDVFYADIDSIAELVGAELHQASRTSTTRLVCATGIVEFTPYSRTVIRNFQATDLPHPTRVIGERLQLPVRGLDLVLPLSAAWDEEARMWTLTCEDRRLQVAVPEDLFEITIDRSDRTLEVRYAGQRLVKWACCTGEGNNSPIGQWRVINKAVWPPWRAYWGEYMPGGSPRNPLGARWLGTSARGYATGRVIGIHGTNQPSSIGRRISGGCIRLTNAHAIEMYNTIPVGSRVIIQE